MLRRLYAFAAVVSPQRVGKLASLVMVGMIVATAVLAVRDQLSLFPPPPPTPAETAAARPQATRDWAMVAARLQARFDDKPLEVGEVWATRTGRICGFVDARRTNTDNIQPFFTTPDLKPHMKGDDLWAFMGVWKGCLDDRWVELHVGTEQTGFCASARASRSTIARQTLCVGYTPQ